MKLSVSEAYEVPDDVLGYLEWVSGMLYINESKQKWRLVGCDESHHKE